MTPQTKPVNRGVTVARILFASLGIILTVAGLSLLAIDAMKGQDSGIGRRSLLELATSPAAERLPIAQDFADWLRRPRSFAFLAGPLTVALDLIPQSVALMVLGGILVWRGLRT